MVLNHYRCWQMRIGQSLLAGFWSSIRGPNIVSDCTDYAIFKFWFSHFHCSTAVPRETTEIFVNTSKLIFFGQNFYKIFIRFFLRAWRKCYICILMSFLTLFKLTAKDIIWTVLCPVCFCGTYRLAKS